MHKVDLFKVKDLVRTEEQVGLRNPITVLGRISRGRQHTEWSKNAVHEPLEDRRVRSREAVVFARHHRGANHCDRDRLAADELAGKFPCVNAERGVVCVGLEFACARDESRSGPNRGGEVAVVAKRLVVPAEHGRIGQKMLACFFDVERKAFVWRRPIRSVLWEEVKGTNLLLLFFHALLAVAVPCGLICVLVRPVKGIDETKVGLFPGLNLLGLDLGKHVRVHGAVLDGASVNQRRLSWLLRRC
mmetsp:Transcript_15044/g.47885  ORF Transcript_15044/g.47885 Transcript_15044/m.47885 type:complete len:245 (-) Transcript_15044:193-927(-)